MFIVAIKLTKARLALFALCVAAVVVCLTVVLPAGDVAASGQARINYSGIKTNEDRIAFLSQFGWKVVEEPIEVEEVTIPSEWNDVYENYNEIQKRQGLDLKKYMGKDVKRWTYLVTNYPKETGSEVHANLLIYGSRIIGGDISSVDLNGFMHGFKYEG